MPSHAASALPVRQPHDAELQLVYQIPPHNVPAVASMDGIYRVTWRKTRSPHRAADIGEPGTPVDVVALAVTHLPPDCGPAVVGTADDA